MDLDTQNWQPSNKIDHLSIIDMIDETVILRQLLAASQNAEEGEPILKNILAQK